MSAGSHVHRLFSAAYDEALSPAEAEGFNGHLAACPACATAFQEYREGLRSLRLLPVERMPVAIHLPVLPPGAGVPRTWSGPWDRLFRRLGARGGAAGKFRGRPSTAGWVMGAAVLVVGAVVAVFSQARPVAPASGTALATAGGTRIAPLDRPGATSPPGAATPSILTPECVPMRLAGPAATAPAPPAFSNRISVGGPQRPHQQLLLATTGNQVVAGSRVPVYARLIAPAVVAGLPGAAAPQVNSVLVPCVSLSVAASPALGPRPAGVDTSNAGLPLAIVTVPAELAPGTVIQVTATMPAGVPTAGDSPLTAEITLVVR